MRIGARHLRFNPNSPGIHLGEIRPRVSRGDIAILVLLLTVGLVIFFVLRPSPSESVSISPGLGTPASNPSGPLKIKGPLVIGKSEWLKPGMEYVYSIPRQNLPLLINITSGRVRLLRSRPNPEDLRYHVGETNLWGGFYKLFPADLKGLSTGQPPIYIEVKVGGKYLARRERPI